MMSLKVLCSIFPEVRCNTIIRASSLFSAGWVAIRLLGRSNLNSDNFISLRALFPEGAIFEAQNYGNMVDYQNIKAMLSAKWRFFIFKEFVTKTIANRV